MSETKISEGSVPSSPDGWVFAGLTNVQTHDLVSDVLHVLKDGNLASSLFQIRGTNKYFKGLINAKLRQRNMQKALLVCFLRITGMQGTEKALAQHVQEVIARVLRNSGVLMDHHSPETPDIRAKTKHTTMRHDRESLFSNVGGVNIDCMDSDYEALIIVSVYAIAEHIKHAQKELLYDQSVEKSLRIDNLLEESLERPLPEMVGCNTPAPQPLTPTQAQAQVQWQTPPPDINEGAFEVTGQDWDIQFGDIPRETNTGLCGIQTATADMSGNDHLPDRYLDTQRALEFDQVSESGLEDLLNQWEPEYSHWELWETPSEWACDL